jgi:hypothetical protein
MRAIVAGLVTVCLALLGYIGVVKVAPRALVFGAIDDALAREYVAGVRVADLERTLRTEADGVERVAWRAVLEGTVQTLAARSHAEDIVSGVRDVLEVDADRVAVSQPDALRPPDPTMATVVFHLSWEAGRVAASGKLPSEVATDIPLKLATQFPGAVLTTDLRPLPGPAAPALRGVIDSAVRALSVARRGKVEIRDGTFVLDAVYGAPEMESSVRTLVTERPDARCGSCRADRGRRCRVGGAGRGHRRGRRERGCRRCDPRHRGRRHARRRPDRPGGRGRRGHDRPRGKPHARAVQGAHRPAHRG